MNDLTLELPTLPYVSDAERRKSSGGPHQEITTTKFLYNLQTVVMRLLSGSGKPPKSTDYNEAVAYLNKSIMRQRFQTFPVIPEVVDAESMSVAKTAAFRILEEVIRHLPEPEVVSTGARAYQEYIESPQWMARRLRLFKVRGTKCESCQSGQKIRVHHLHYGNLGNEQDDDLQVLCDACHTREHEIRPKDTFSTAKSCRKWLKRANPDPQYNHGPVKIIYRES